VPRSNPLPVDDPSLNRGSTAVHSNVIPHYIYILINSKKKENRNLRYINLRISASRESIDILARARVCCLCVYVCVCTYVWLICTSLHN